MRRTPERGLTGARALVFAAILFTPAATSADSPAKDGESPPGDTPIDPETQRYCEEWRSHCNPRSRAGCFPEERCRVWYDERRARERSDTPGE